MAEVEEIKVDPRTRDKISALAKQKRKLEGEIIRELADDALRKGNKNDKKEEGGKSGMDDMKEIYLWKILAQQDAQPQQPVQQAPSVNPMTEMMQMMMAATMMKNMTQPEPDYAQKLQLQKAMKGGNEDEVKRIQEDMKKEQKEMMDRFERMLSDKKTKDDMAEIKEMITKKMADEGIEKLRTTLDEKLKPSGKKSLAEELKDNVSAWNALKDFARATGMTDKQMTTPEGKVDWGAIAEKTLDTVKTFADRMPVQPPKQQELAEIPLTGNIVPSEIIGEGVEQGAQGEVILRGEPPAQGSGEAAPPPQETPPATESSAEVPPEAPAPSDAVAPVQPDAKTEQEPPLPVKASKGEKYPCLEPGCDFGAKTKSGLLSHTRSHKNKHPAKVNKLAPKSTADDTTNSQPNNT